MLDQLLFSIRIKNTVLMWEVEVEPSPLEVDELVPPDDEVPPPLVLPPLEPEAELPGPLLEPVSSDPPSPVTFPADDPLLPHPLTLSVTPTARPATTTDACFSPFMKVHPD
jgi:hypothetical protein